LLDCIPDLAQVRRRKCRVHRDVDIAEGVGASISGGRLWVVADKRRIRQRFTQPDAVGEVVR
jgi:hypothetical protein